jgi:hypothetical protein
MGGNSWGTYNLAFGFAKPLVMHEATRGPEDFEVSAFFSKEGELVALLNHLAEHREEIKLKAASLRANPKFNFEFQQKKYVEFLERKR